MRKVHSLAVIPIVVVAVLFGIAANTLSLPKQGQQLIVVASDQAFEAAKNWVGFLETQTIPVKHVLPNELEKYKKEKNMVILWAPAEPGGKAGEPLASVMTKDELDWIKQQGNKRLYIKNDLWEKDQTVLVFAAYTNDAIQKAIKENRDNWWEIIMSWFDIDMTPAQIRGY